MCLDYRSCYKKFNFQIVMETFFTIWCVVTKNMNGVALMIVVCVLGNSIKIVRFSNKKEQQNKNLFTTLNLLCSIFKPLTLILSNHLLLRNLRFIDLSDYLSFTKSFMSKINTHYQIQYIYTTNFVVKFT